MFSQEERRANERQADPSSVRAARPDPAPQAGVGAQRAVRRPPQPLPLDAVLGRAVLARKVRDLPTEGLTRVAPKGLLILDAYNKSPQLGALGAAELELEQRDKDRGRLNTLADYVEDYAEGSPEEALAVAISQHSAELDEMKRSDLLSVSVPVATPMRLTFTTPFPKAGLTAPPRKHAHMFAVDAIPVQIGGKSYSLLPAQDFLNAGQSAIYQRDKSQIKAGADAIPVFLFETGHPHPITREEISGQGVAVLGDFHHRFVWGAFHGDPLSIVVKKGTPQTPPRLWSDVTYQLAPKSEYEHGAERAVDEEIFFRAMSAQPELHGKAFGEGWEEFLRQEVRRAKRHEVTVNDEELGALHDFLIKRRMLAAPFDVAVKNLVAEARAAHAPQLGAILIGSFEPGEGPMVAYGPASSVGYYDPDAHVIVVDPSQNPDADARLDTLAFEAGNALRRAEYRAKERSTADIEFEVLEGYVEMLGRSVGRKSYTLLMDAMGVDRELHNRIADPRRSIEAGALLGYDGSPVMPPKSEMPEQRARTAFTAWLQLGWSREQRRRYFGVSAHAEGMAASGAVYV